MKSIMSFLFFLLLTACNPAWWPFEAKIAEDIIEDVDQELKQEAPQPKDPPPMQNQMPGINPLLKVQQV